MNNWIYIILSSIVLLVIFPFKITAIVELLSEEKSLKVMVFLFNYNLLSSNYLLFGREIIIKTKSGEPKSLDIEAEKKNASRAKIALKPKRVDLNLLICNESNPYIQSSIVNFLLNVVSGYARQKNVKFFYRVLPINYVKKVSVYGKFTFNTTLLRLASSYVSNVLS